MNCREARRRMSPYLDSELDPTTTFEISEHVRVCEPCRRRFEAERLVDQQIVSRLRGGELPDSTWQEIQQEVLHGPRHYRFRLPALLAVAAALAAVVWAGQAWILGSGAPSGASAVSQLLHETGGGAPYAVSAPSATMPEDGRMPVFAELTMRLSAQVMRPHLVQMVSVRRESGDGGETVVVRLNCCGEPVLLQFARRGRPGQLADVAVALASREQLSYQHQGVNVAARRIGDFVVLGASRHPLAHLMDAVSVQ